MSRYHQPKTYFFNDIPASLFFDLLDQADKARLEELLELAQLIGLAQSSDFAKFKQKTLDDIYPWLPAERKARAERDKQQAIENKQAIESKVSNMFKRKKFVKEGG